MREDLLLSCKKRFLERYPMGMNNPELEEIRKKHKVEKMKEKALLAFEDNKFLYTDQIIEDMIKLTTSSSLVSVFEKPKFRDYLRGLSIDRKKELADAFHQRLYGNTEIGFERMVDLFRDGKMAKWTILTVLPYYMNTEVEVFMKPTTVKNIIRVFELDMVYKPRPTYSNYEKFKTFISEMKEIVGPEITNDNGAFTGFLMMTMDV